MTIKELAYSAQQHLQANTGGSFKRAHVYELLAASFGFNSHAAFGVDTVLTELRQNDRRVVPQSALIKQRCIELGYQPDIVTLASSALESFLAERQIGDGAIQTVNARDLHAFLEVGKDFSNWVKDRIQKYGFVENQDFVIASPVLAKQSGRGGDRCSKDYHLSLDMAKELAMVERNDKGKQARQYFIECERRAKANVIGAGWAAIPQTLPEALRLAADLAEQKAKAEAQLAIAAPKAQFHDAVTEAINCQSVQEVAKVLGTGSNRLFKFLRDEGLLMRDNLPYQQHLDAGHFRVVEKQYNDGRGESYTYTRTLVTGKGLAYIQKRLQA